jgi:hypothetical protein
VLALAAGPVRLIRALHRCPPGIVAVRGRLSDARCSFAPAGSTCSCRCGPREHARRPFSGARSAGSKHPSRKLSRRAGAAALRGAVRSTERRRS